MTLGPPFLEKGFTEFRAPVTKSLVLIEGNGDFEKYTTATVSGGFATHLIDPARDDGYFIAWSPRSSVALGYLWRQKDFPWLGVWEENYQRTGAPWSGRTLTRGMEFGASPVAETRRRMIERGPLFGAPTFRWIPARGCVTVEYFAAIQGGVGKCPARLDRSTGDVRFAD